jgi:CHASE3 domain sensor protein|tara:strand:+ start:1131 stop:1391 length:261 start_codon:yes stop_codon:yes gene_type:complete
MLTKYETKYLLESELTKVENLIDVVGKNAHHIQDLYADIKKKDETINKLLIRINEKRDKIYELQEVIKSQRDKDIHSILDPHGANN